MHSPATSYIHHEESGVAPEVIVDEDPQYSQDTMSRWRVSRELVTVIASLMIILTSGGLILGFSPLYSLLVEEGQWSETCGDEEISAGTCATQETHLQYIYSTAFLFLSVANAVFGVLLDFIGPRYTTMIGLMIAFIGNLLLAYGESTTANGLAIVVGFTFIGAGGYASYITAFQFIQLYTRQGVILSFVSGLFNTSGYVYMLLMTDGFTRKGFFTVYAFIVLLCAVVCWVVYPNNSVTKPNKHYTLSCFSRRLPKITKPRGLWTDVKSQLYRKDLWFFAVFFGWISTINAYTGGALPNILYKAAGANESLGDTYVNYVSPTITNGSFVWTPIVGWAMEKYGFKHVFVATLVVMQLFMVFLMIDSLGAQIVSLLLFSIGQSAFYALQFSYIMFCFPAEVYGSLEAFLACWSFFLGLLNYAFNPWTQNQLNGNYNYVLVIMIVPTVIFYLFIPLVKNGLPEQRAAKEALLAQEAKLSVAAQ